MLHGNIKMGGSGEFLKIGARYFCVLLSPRREAVRMVILLCGYCDDTSVMILL